MAEDFLGVGEGGRFLRGTPPWGQVPFPQTPSSWHVCPCPEQCPPCSGYHERQLAHRESSQLSGAVSTGCKYNQVNSHFHCIREGCQFSFLLKHQMTSHARKHMRRMLGKNFDRVPSSQVSRPSTAWPRGQRASPVSHSGSHWN